MSSNSTGPMEGAGTNVRFASLHGLAVGPVLSTTPVPLRKPPPVAGDIRSKQSH